MSYSPNGYRFSNMKAETATTNSIVYVLLCVLLLALFPLFSGWIIVSVINLIIITSYLLFFPRNLFHPNHIIFAFSFLYVVLPSTTQWFYDTFNITYLLPWGKVSHWNEYYYITYLDIILSYLTFFFSFYWFNIKRKEPVYFNVQPRKLPLYILIYSSFISLFYFLMMTGGISTWINDYKSAFLLGRQGLGPLNLLILNLINLTVFMLGLEFYRLSGVKRKYIFLLALILIIFASYLQGLKSRFIILMIIFFFPYLFRIKLSLLKVIALGNIFFAILFIGNYIRSNGFYGTFRIFFEYMMTYFNTFEIHNLIIKDIPPGIFQTVHHVLVKPANALGLMANEEYDLSIMLTKKYFPKDWELMNATQQWPLITDLRLNYYGFFLGWLAIALYAWILSKIYGHVLRGNIALMLIFILEFIRLFTVQRGTLLPWQLPIYLFFYVLIYLYVRLFVIYNPILSKNK